MAALPYKLPQGTVTEDKRNRRTNQSRLTTGKHTHTQADQKHKKFNTIQAESSSTHSKAYGALKGQRP